MRKKKQTAWKRNRKFGDVYGGRSRLKIADRIWARAHSIERPTDADECPIFLVDNPSRDFFFPLSVEEIESELAQLPELDVDGITYVWLKRAKKTGYQKGEYPLAEFICGSGVRLIVLYPAPIDMRLYLGSRKPTQGKLQMYAPYTEQVECDEHGWYVVFEEKALKDFYVEQLLYHEVGHHIDWYFRHWSKANLKQKEEFANQYAFEMTTMRRSYENLLTDE